MTKSKVRSGAFRRPGGSRADQRQTSNVECRMSNVTPASFEDRGFSQRHKGTKAGVHSTRIVDCRRQRMLIELCVPSRPMLLLAACSPRRTRRARKGEGGQSLPRSSRADKRRTSNVPPASFKYQGLSQSRKGTKAEFNRQKMSIANDKKRRLNLCVLLVSRHRQRDSGLLHDVALIPPALADADPALPS